MIKKLYEDAKNGINRRQNLSQIRNEIKDFVKMDAFYEMIIDELDVIISFLNDEDAKTRKNTALLMKDMDMSDFLLPLMEAYLKEQTLFVRSSYLDAIQNYEYDEYLPQLKKRLQELMSEEISMENKKHYEEEIKFLNQLISNKEGFETHHFHGFSKEQDVILVCNKMQKDTVLQEVKELPISAKFIDFSSGVRLKTKDIKTLFLVRSFHSMLFMIEGVKTISSDPIEVAKAIAESNFWEVIQSSHDGKAPYYFRVECKSDKTLEQKSQYVKKLANELQIRSQHQLVNNPSHYEFEFRIIENASGKCNILVKFFTIKDNRFTYQVMPYATSLKPANAALLVALAKPYMIADAQVLDPYVAGGELLIERQFEVKANTSYGLDKRAEALESAKRHAFESNQIIHFVQKDFASFSHEYLFDEIFTQMPYSLKSQDVKHVKEEYYRFFAHVNQVVKPTATLILYSHNLEFIREYAAPAGWKIIKDITIGSKEKTHLVILKQ